MLNVLNLLKYQLSVCDWCMKDILIRLDSPLDMNVSQMIISVQLNCSMLISLSMNKGPFTLNKTELESDHSSTWVHRKSNLLFTFSSSKDQRKFSVMRSLSVSVNEPFALMFLCRLTVVRTCRRS